MGRLIRIYAVWHSVFQLYLYSSFQSIVCLKKQTKQMTNVVCNLAPKELSFLYAMWCFSGSLKKTAISNVLFFGVFFVCFFFCFFLWWRYPPPFKCPDRGPCSAVLIHYWMTLKPLSKVFFFFFFFFFSLSLFFSHLTKMWICKICGKLTRLCRVDSAASTLLTGPLPI